MSTEPAPIFDNTRLHLATPGYPLPIAILLSLVLLGVFFASQLLGIAGFSTLILSNVSQLPFEQKLALGGQNGTVISLAVIATLFSVVLAIILMLRQRRSNITDHLGIKGFSWQQGLVFIIFLIILNVIINALTIWLDREPMEFMEILAKTAKPLWLLVFAMVIIAPIYEELIFRGFIWTGLATSRLGVWGASLITSIIFAWVHFQYGWVEALEIIALAMLFSVARVRSGSLLLPMMLHILNNGLAMWQYLSFGH